MLHDIVRGVTRGIGAAALMLAAGVLVAGPVHAKQDSLTPVVVTNTPDETIPTQHPREPIYIEGSVDVEVNSGGAILGNYTVPSDRRLVIEHVSFATNFVVCEYVSSVSVRVSTPGLGSADFYANPLQPIALPNSSTRFTRGSQAMKLYAGPDGSVQVNWTRSATGCTTSASFAISGYLEEDLQ